MLNIGVIGYGYWGPNLVRNLVGIKGATLTKVCDLDNVQLKKVKELYPWIVTVNEYMNILEDKDIDAVIIATPPETHFEIAKKAMELGKHVFVEKPITTDVKDSEKLVDLAASKKRVLMVGHVFLYTGAVKKIKEIIESGDIGKILHIRSTRLNLGLFESGKDVVWNIKRGKNVIWDFMPHDISLILYLLGNKTPKKIVATGNAHIEKGIEDTAFVNLIFDDGVNATISASWLDAVKVREFTIIGSKKMIVFDDVEPLQKVKIYNKGVESKFNSFGEWQTSFIYGDIFIPKVDNTEPLRVELQHFVACIELGFKPLSDGDNGLKVVEIINQIEDEVKKCR